MFRPRPMPDFSRAFLLVAVACTLVVTAASSALGGEYVPSVRDEVVYDLARAAQSQAFPEALTIDAGGAVFYTHSDYNRPVALEPDESNYVIGLSAVGSEIFRKGAADYSQFYWPGGLDFAANGSLLVADTENHRILSIDLGTGNTLFSSGAYGTGSLEFSSPGGITVSPNGSIWVTDTYNNRVQRLSPAGQYLGQWSVGDGALPDDIEADAAGNLWIALQGENRVVKYSPTGEELMSIDVWQETDAAGIPTVTGEFWGPRGLALDPWGALYVADTENGRLVRFGQDGSWLGTYNPAGVLENPSDIDIDSLGAIYVSDCSADAVFKFHMAAADVDDVPPVTTSNISAGWITSKPFMLTLSSTDASSQIEATHFTTDGSEPTTQSYISPVSITDEGTTTVKYRSVDKAQNFEPVVTEYVRIDTVAPQSAIDAPSYVYGYEADVALSASDVTSGIRRITYIVDSIDTGTYVAPFKVLGPGTHTVEYYATDNAGNVESLRTLQIVIEAPDIYPPHTTSNIPGGWINQDLAIVLSADDPSGVSGTFISLDGSEPTSAYAGAIPITSEGTTTVKYFSVDGRNNVEGTKTDLLRIDKSNPVSSSNAKASYIGSATIEFQATDAVSGVLAMTYSVDGGPWLQGFNAQIDTWGNHSIVWYATDRAGNQEAYRSADFVIYQPDNEPPITGDNIPSGWMRGPFHIQFDAMDDISGVSGTYYSTDGSAPSIPYSGPFWFNTEGEYVVKFYSQDLQGNNEVVKSRTLQIDNTAPVSSDNALSSYTESATITLQANDTYSTIAGLWYRLDEGSWVKIISGQSLFTNQVGSHKLEYYAIDAAGNTEPTHTRYFTLTVPDQTPPVTTFIAPSSWVTDTASVMLSAVDASSAVAGTWYDIGGATPSTLYSAPFLISAEGTTTISYRSADVWGNMEETQTGTVRVDSTPPVTSTDATASYVDEAVLNLAPSDSLSGVRFTKYRVDGGAWTTGTVAAVNGYLGHTVQYYSVDFAGNTESVKQVFFTIKRADKTYEQTHANIMYRGTWSSAYSNNAQRSTDSTAVAWFYAQATRIRLNAYTAPDAGIARVSIDGGAWIPVDLYTSATNSNRTVWDSGDISFDYHLVKFEYTGTKNPLSSGAAINVDKVIVEGNLYQVPDSAAPVTTSDISTAWQRGPVAVALESTDATTGVEFTYYSTNGTTPTIPYSSAVNITTEGSTEFKYYSVDRRGNQEAVKSQTVRIDNTAPITSSNAQTSYLTTASITLSPADVHSGVAATRWRVNGSEWTSGTVATVPFAMGEHVLEWYSIDAVGNTETTNSATIGIVDRADNLDSRIVYQGTWVSSAHTSRYGGAWLTAAAANRVAYVLFTGTRVELLGSMGPDLGIARVTVDGGDPTFVDLYSLTSKHQQKIFVRGGLPNTKHIVTVEWTGTKNAASSGMTVGLDGVDVGGTLDADIGAPVTSNSTTGAWRSADELVTFSSQDADTYVKSTHYRVNSGAVTTYTAPFSVSSDGTSSIEYFSVDGAGNTEATKTATVRIDRTAPSVTDNAPATWSRGPVSVRLDSSDAQSGVGSVLYSTDGSEPSIAYTSGVVVSSEGTTAVRYKAIDAVGNVSATASTIVRIDNTAPASSSNAPASWVTGPVDVTLGATDALSGVAEIRYTVNGSAVATYSAPVRITAEGTNTIAFSAVDAAGNLEATKTATIRIDDSAPVTTSNAAASYLGTATITFSPTDSLSGVSATQYRVDGGSWTAGTEVTLTQAGTFTLQWRSIDAAGNTEAAKTAGFSVAKRFEQTDARAYFSGTWGLTTHPSLSGGSFRTTSGSGSAAYVTFEGTKLDWISSRNTTYGKARVSLDDGAPVDVDLYGTFGFQQTIWSTGVLTDGQHRLKIEYTGSKNASSTGYSIGIDAFDIVGQPVPDTLASVTTDNASPSWRSSNATVTLSAVDVHSFVNSTHYRVNSGVVTTYTAPFSVSSDGTSTIEYFSVDGAGNTEATKTATVRIDRTAPSVTDNAPATWSRGPVSVRLDSSDAQSGVGSVLYSTDGSEPSIAYTSGVVVSSEGTTAVRYKAIDGVGNVSATASTIVRIDNTAPASSSNAPASWVTGPVDVTLGATDALSGVAAIRYTVNGSAVATYSAPVRITAEGTNTIAFSAVDAAGNLEATKTATIRIDDSAPVTTSNAAASYLGTATITFSPTDFLSGVSTTQYRIDGGSWTSGTSAAVAFVGGAHTIEWRSTDSVGNTESVKSAAFTMTKRVEQTATALSYRGPWTTTSNAGLSGGSFKSVDFAGSSVKFTFTGTRVDWITSRNSSYGIARITLDNNPPVTVDLYGGFAFKQPMWSSGNLPNSVHTVQIDYTGTKNPASSGHSIGIDALDVTGELVEDTAAPITTCDTSQAWRSASATLALTPTDSDGFAIGTYYRLNGGTTVNYGAPFVVSAEGTTVVDYWSVDAAGNVESTRTTLVRVDKTAPVPTDDASGAWSAGNVVLRIAATDVYSGVSSIQYSTDDSTPSVTYTGPVTITAEGTTSVKYRATDQVGNTSSIRSAIVRIDRTGPTASDNAPTEWRNTPTTVTLSAVDSMSGVGNINYTMNSVTSTYTAPIVVSGQGVYFISYGASDNVGNHGASRTTTVSIDLTAPTTTASVNTTYTGPASVSFASTDAGGSGVSITKWRIDGGSWNTGVSASLPFTGGPHVLEWHSIDTAGNSETVKSAQYTMVKRFEQTDSKVTFSGTWSTINHGSLSGGSFKTSFTPSSAVDVAFTGTQIDWITSRNTSYGKARVILDGGIPVEVDLYGSFSFAQKVWSSGPLANGPHTLRIEYSGLKNPSSSGYTIGLDALDVTGELSSRRYEQSSSLIAAEGSWSTINHASLSGGSFQSAASSGTALNIAFTGTKIEWVTSRNTSYGKARVTIDGSSTVEVDLYGQFSFRQTVWSSAQLAEGPHTVRIEYTGTKNPLSSGFAIGIDALDVTGILTQAAPPTPPYTVLEESNSKIVYDGNWSTVSNSGLSGGTFKTANGDPNAAVNVSFTGTRIDWITSRNGSYGKASVSVDGGSAVEVDLYGSFGFQRPVWTSGTLTDGNHTVRIEYLGTKNTASTGYSIGADAFNVYGTILQAVSPLPPGTRHEETSPLLTWGGSWGTNNAADFSSGSQRVASTLGQIVSVKFSGTRLYWIGARNTNYGIARVTVDGGTPITVDAYGSYGLKQVIWQSGALADGVHTVTIEALGTKTGASSGTWISVDGVDVVGTLLQADPLGPTLTRFEQDAAGVRYSGTWSTTSHSDLSGGSFKSASTPTASVEATFSGTRLDWVTSTNTSYGIARVSVDGGAWVDVDLYGAFGFKQRVWTSGTLSDTTHTVRIEYTGRKNPLSSGQTIGIDALDIAGALVQ